MVIKRKNIATFFLIIYILCVFSTSLFFVCHSEHECIGENCNICYGINLIKNVLELMKILLFIFLVIKDSGIKSKNICKVKYNLTPVLLGVNLLE